MLGSKQARAVDDAALGVCGRRSGRAARFSLTVTYAIGLMAARLDSVRQRGADGAPEPASTETSPAGGAICQAGGINNVEQS